MFLSQAKTRVVPFPLLSACVFVLPWFEIHHLQWQSRRIIPIITKVSDNKYYFREYWSNVMLLIILFRSKGSPKRYPSPKEATQAILERSKFLNFHFIILFLYLKLKYWLLGRSKASSKHAIFAKEQQKSTRIVRIGSSITFTKEGLDHYIPHFCIMPQKIINLLL